VPNVSASLSSAEKALLLRKLGVSLETGFNVTYKDTLAPTKFFEPIEGKRVIWKNIKRDTAFRVGPGDIVLDLGCGRCELDVPLAEEVHLVVGLDINVPHLLLAKDNVIPAFNVDNIVLFLGGLATGTHEPHIRFNDACFDAIFCHAGVGKDEVFNVMLEIARILKPGRQWLFAYPRVWFTGDWSPNELEERLLRYAHDQYPNWRQRSEAEFLEAAQRVGFRPEGEKVMLEGSVERPLGTNQAMFGLDSLELFMTREQERRTLWAQYQLNDANLPVACFVLRKK
jgi:SAM-dependent methyltransferase